MSSNHLNDVRSEHSSAIAILISFFRLGLTSFGGPIAHIGFFRDEFVTRKKWLTDASFGELVSLCQFLPGPTSSQIGFMIGFLRGGPIGAILAWIGFTLPSAIAMTGFAYGVLHFNGPVGQNLVHGLKLVAVVVVAQALLGMVRTLTPDRPRMVIALLSAALILLSSHSIFQLIAITSGGMLGLILCRSHDKVTENALLFPLSQTAGAIILVLFSILLIALPALARIAPIIDFISKFYEAGSLVFGGGHVVLPLLDQKFVDTGLIDKNSFLAGYGATQAMPGPLFTFASYLGALAKNGPQGIGGALIGTISIFLPGFLLAIGIAPFWTYFKKSALFRAAIAGASASIVGVLGAAFYNPIWTSAVISPADFLLVSLGYMLLTQWKIPNWALVFMLPALSALIGQLEL